MLYIYPPRPKKRKWKKVCGKIILLVFTLYWQLDFKLASHDLFLTIMDKIHWDTSTCGSCFHYQKLLLLPQATMHSQHLLWSRGNTMKQIFWCCTEWVAQRIAHWVVYFAAEPETGVKFPLSSRVSSEEGNDKYTSEYFTQYIIPVYTYCTGHIL